MSDRGELLRGIPKVDEMLQDERLVFLSEQKSRAEVRNVLRNVLGDIRASILDGTRLTPADTAEIAEKTARCLEREQPEESLHRVVNATGVVLHTNLGRALLSERAVRAVEEAAENYTNLEYDLETGRRGDRTVRIERLVQKLTGAEAAMAVNNNASAVLLALSALAAGREAVVSRGEEVEIGGSFRIPEIMALSGAVLREVGTTNRTSPSDYENACGPETAALLKVSMSNYRIVGYTKSASLSELSFVAAKYGIPLICDLGSGLFLNLRRFGIDEPVIGEAIAAGADVVTCSGDKLAGGPQIGLIAGRKEYIEKMKRHPLARVLRVDKMTLAAMEATLAAYADGGSAFSEIPTLAMISEDRNTLRERAGKLCRELTAGVRGFRFSVADCVDRTGGGTAPTGELEGAAVEAEPDGTEMDAEDAARRLHQGRYSVLVRLSRGRILLSVRTIRDSEFVTVVRAFQELCRREV